MDMRELDDILRGLVDVDYSIRCLLQVIAALEEYYCMEEDRVQKNTLYTIRKFLESVECDLEETSEQLDKYILTLE